MRLAGLVPIPARILAVEPGCAWEWQVGPVRMRHLVQPGEVALELSAREPLETAVALTYGPAIALLLRNLARVAGGGAVPAGQAG